MRLKPGEVGLRDNRATFHLGVGGGGGVTKDMTAVKGVKPKTGLDGRSTGAVYYHMQPEVVDGKTAKNNYSQRKHVMRVLPPLPANTNPAVGPISGLPIGGDEHVLVLRLGKRNNESDEMAPLQIEVRLPKETKKPTEASTQFQEEDYLPAAPAPVPTVKVSKKKKGKKEGRKKSKK